MVWGYSLRARRRQRCLYWPDVSGRKGLPGAFRRRLGHPFWKARFRDSDDFDPRDYDARLSWRRDSAKAIELRKQVLRHNLHRYARVVVVGGKEYLAAVSDAYAGTGISVEPVSKKPLRIGQLIQALSLAVNRGVELGEGTASPMHSSRPG